MLAPDGSVYTNLFNALGPGVGLGKLDANGNLLWFTLEQASVLSTPDVGPDGTVYDGRNLLNLYALNSNGTTRWQYTDSGILFAPVVSPVNDLLLVPGIVDYGQPGFFEAISTSGTSLWKQVLPVENGLNIVPMSRARFTPNGQTAYVGMSIPGQGADAYTYLYAVQTGNAVSLSSLALNPTQLIGGGTSTGTVTLSSPAPSGGVVVSLTSDNPQVASVPPTVTVNGGQTTASFTVNTTPVSSSTVVNITAAYGTSHVSAGLTVKPPDLASFSLSPTQVRGGTPSTGTLTLTGPAPSGGVTVRVSSNNPILVNVPATVTIPAGRTSVTFTARTRVTTRTITVTVSAWTQSVLKRATLTVTP